MWLYKNTKMNKKVYKNYGEVDFEDQTEQIEEQCEKDIKEVEGSLKWN